MNVNLTDGRSHDLELYFLDMQSSPSRVEQVQISDAATGAVLDTETVSSFTKGTYLNWIVQGDVVITFTKESGVNAVVSGIFLDPPATSATFLSSDTTTQGNWIGEYGAQGYDVIGDTPRLPSYATVTPSGQSYHLWSNTTTSASALQNPGGSGRIAAAWYATTSFSVNVNLTDGRSHDLELYFLDMQSSPSRVEQVQISDAATGAVLDTETISSFTKGTYLNWLVQGDVNITITHEAGVNAVVSGIFIDPATGAPSSPTSAVGVKHDNPPQDISITTLDTPTTSEVDSLDFPGGNVITPPPTIATSTASRQLVHDVAVEQVSSGRRRFRSLLEGAGENGGKTGHRGENGT